MKKYTVEVAWRQINFCSEEVTVEAEDEDKACQMALDTVHFGDCDDWDCSNAQVVDETD